MISFVNSEHRTKLNPRFKAFWPSAPDVTMFEMWESCAAKAVPSSNQVFAYCERPPRHSLPEVRPER